MCGSVMSTHTLTHPQTLPFRVVEGLDIVLHIEHRSVGPHDFDVVREAGAVGQDILHGQLARRDVAAVALDAIGRRFAGRRGHRDVGLLRQVEQAGERVVGRDEAAVGVMGDCDGNGRARDEVCQRAQTRAQLVRGGVLRRLEQRGQAGHQNPGEAGPVCSRLFLRGRPS